MKKKYLIVGFALLFLIVSAVILFYSKSSDENEEEITGSQIMETGESVREDEQGEKSGDSGEESTDYCMRRNVWRLDIVSIPIKHTIDWNFC